MVQKNILASILIANYNSSQYIKQCIESLHIPCPQCGKHDFTDIRQFNLMFKTFQGVTEECSAWSNYATFY